MKNKKKLILRNWRIRLVDVIGIELFIVSSTVLLEAKRLSQTSNCFFLTTVLIFLSVRCNDSLNL